MKRMKNVKNPEVTVGIHEGAGDNDGVSVLQIGIWNEFGTSRIPARSFLRAWFDENGAKVKQWLKVGMRAVAKGRLSKAQLFDQIGLKIVGEIQARISAGVPPPNAASTIRQKGSSKPLINTGVLRSSITHRVLDSKDA